LASDICALICPVAQSLNRTILPIGLHRSDFAVVLLLVRQSLLQGVLFCRDLRIESGRVSMRIDCKRGVALRRKLPNGFLGLLANLRQGLRLLNLAVTHAD